jgi:hypothetical protein
LVTVTSTSCAADLSPAASSMAEPPVAAADAAVSVTLKVVRLIPENAGNVASPV